MPTPGEVISGQAYIIDSDTLAIGGTKIRLQGIGAPETVQLCLDRSAAKWTCGIAARNRLAQHIAGRSIECLPDGVDRYHSTLAVCQLGNENLNAWMVCDGLALAVVKYSTVYVEDEVEARKKRGAAYGPARSSPDGIGATKDYGLV
jgi:endonuclease YncB( thermonuclease family)